MHSSSEVLYSEGLALLKTFEGFIDEHGTISLKEPVDVQSPCRVLITVLGDLDEDIPETALLSEDALAEDWNRSEEDLAWRHLQPEVLS